MRDTATNSSGKRRQTQLFIAMRLLKSDSTYESWLSSKASKPLLLLQPRTMGLYVTNAATSGSCDQISLMYDHKYSVCTAWPVSTDRNTIL